MSRAVVFGATGALGSAIVERLRTGGWVVEVASRNPGPGVSLDLSDDSWPTKVGSVDGVVWAQGQNAGGGVREATGEQMHALYESNVVFITETLAALEKAGSLAKPSRGVVISSIWQISARSNKLAYVASKAALAGLVPAIAADMANEHFSLNGILPGVIDTPMTREQLSREQLTRVQSDSLGGALATPANVANATAWLVDPQAAGINGQWVAVDNGWSAVRSV